MQPRCCAIDALSVTLDNAHRLNPHDRDMSIPFKSYVAGLCLVTFATAAHANIEQQVAEYQDASNKYLALLARAQVAHDPAVALGEEGTALIAVVSDDKRFLITTQVRDIELPALEKMCVSAGQILEAIIQFDLPADAQFGLVKLAKGGDISSNATLAVERNLHTFAAPVSRIGAFGFRCNARFARTLNVIRISDQEAAKKASQQVSNSILLMYKGLLNVVTAPNADVIVSASWAEAGAEAAPDLSSILSLKLRSQLRSDINAALPKVSMRVYMSLKAVGDAVADQRCGQWCQL